MYAGKKLASRIDIYRDAGRFAAAREAAAFYGSIMSRGSVSKKRKGDQ